MIVTRFAPSPTGLLHLGNIYAALFAHSAAREAGGRYLVRIEDIDLARCKPEFEAQILDDLHWLGLGSDAYPVRRQSEHFRDYQAALSTLEAMELIYPCFCSRADIQREIRAAGEASHGPVGPIYPGTCRNIHRTIATDRIDAGEIPVWRLDIRLALDRTGPLSFHDRMRGKIWCRPEPFGDVVLSRRDVPTSYHLSVAVDDAIQGITLVTRGEDLFRSTDIHRVLQALLGLPEPEYWHHRLLLGPDGERFAKRKRSESVVGLRKEGHSAAQIVANIKREMVLKDWTRA